MERHRHLRDAGSGDRNCRRLPSGRTHSLTENWKSNDLRGVLETTFADRPKGQQAVQAAPAAADVTAPDVSEIQNQLNAIARDLSSVQQNINELTAGQEQIRKAQGSWRRPSKRILS